MKESSQRRLSRRRFRRVSREARKTEGQVCATYGPDGVPIYFAVSPEATDDEVWERAMVARGAPINRATRMFSHLLDNPGDIDVTIPAIGVNRA